MEKLEKIQMLNTFLARVKHLRGYGDMNSYNLVKEFKSFGKLTENPLPSNQVDDIINELSSPRTWNNGKNNFIQNIETFIDDIKGK
ncbi:hypothetical protein DHW03_04050 [Pedobacter yonginense]|uniref:Uncharacterized protein n=1 Tax=Pedobacter yonginense TaxID=651869 RepID=A0A317EQR9_9SPHI|nr:hypothetical protein [Pedobacter yonginense]PWS29014.1 hypothetical protein DHW03_04050 [Pedobacter yonginense]